MEYSLKNLEKIVQKKADDAFIKSIIRKYINIDITSPFCDVSDLLYAALRTDENSIGKINEEDKNDRRVRTEYFCKKRQSLVR